MGEINAGLSLSKKDFAFAWKVSRREEPSLGRDILKSVTETVAALDSSVQQKILPQLHSLEGEKNEAFLLESLLNLGIRLKSAKQDASAALLLQRLSQADLPQGIQEQAKQEYGAMIGSGAPCLRTEYFLSRSIDDNGLKAIAPMLGTTLLGQTVSTVLRGLRGNLVANLGSFLVEVPVLAGLSHAMAPESGASLGDELIHSALNLGVFRSVSGVRQFIAAGRPLAAGINQLMHSSATFIGLLAARRLEESYGLRPTVEDGTRGVDALYSWLTMSLGNHIGRAAVGGKLARTQTESELRMQHRSDLERRASSLAWSAPLAVRGSLPESPSNPLFRSIWQATKKKLPSDGDERMPSDASGRLDRGILVRQTAANVKIPTAQQSRVAEMLAAERAALLSSSEEASGVVAVIHRLHALTNLAYLARLAGLSQQADELYRDAETQLETAPGLWEAYVDFIGQCRSTPATPEAVQVTPSLLGGDERSLVQEMATFAREKGRWQEASGRIAALAKLDTRLFAYAELILAAYPQDPLRDAGERESASLFAPVEPGSAPASLAARTWWFSIPAGGSEALGVDDPRLAEYLGLGLRRDAPISPETEFLEALRRVKSELRLLGSEHPAGVNVGVGFARFARGIGKGLPESELFSAVEIQKEIGMPAVPPADRRQFKDSLLLMAKILATRGFLSIDSLSEVKTEFRLGYAFLGQAFTALTKKTNLEAQAFFDLARIGWHRETSGDADRDRERVQSEIAFLEEENWTAFGFQGSAAEQVGLRLRESDWQAAFEAVEATVRAADRFVDATAALAYLSHIFAEMSQKPK